MMEAVDMSSGRFEDARHAFRWAEEWMSRPKIKITHNALAGGTGRGAPVDELEETAETILVAVQSAPDMRTAQTFRWSLGSGRGEAGQAVRGHLVELLRKHLAARNRDLEQLQVIATVALQRLRHKELGLKPVPKAAYSRELGVSRQSIDEPGARQLIRTAEDALDEWMEQAVAAIGGRLEEQGIV